MSLIGCRGIAVHNLNVDFVPLPFIEGEVVDEDVEAATLVVRLAETPVPGLGGPTYEDGEQAFFAMLWRKEPMEKPPNILRLKR